MHMLLTIDQNMLLSFRTHSISHVRVHTVSVTPPAKRMINVYVACVFALNM